jgi:hypothetical protein
MALPDDPHPGRNRPWHPHVPPRPRSIGFPPWPWPSTPVGPVAVPPALLAAATLRTMGAVAGGVTLGRDNRFQVAVSADSEDTARKVAASGGSAALILRTLARQKAKEDEKVLPLLDVVKTLRVSSQGPVIFLRANASLDVIERLMNNFSADQAEGTREWRKSKNPVDLEGARPSDGPRGPACCRSPESRAGAWPARGEQGRRDAGSPRPAGRPRIANPRRQRGACKGESTWLRQIATHVCCYPSWPSCWRRRGSSPL